LDGVGGHLGFARELERDELGLISRDLEARAAQTVAELDVGNLVDLLGRVDVLHVVVERLAQQQALGLPIEAGEGVRCGAAWEVAVGGRRRRRHRRR